MNDMKGELGLDLAFNPELQTALEIERIIKFPSAKSIESFASGKALMVEFDILENNPIVGKSIIEISKEYKNKVLFGLIKRGGENIIPKGDVVIKANDILYIIGAEQDITDFSKKLRIFKPKAKSAFIIGGGKIAYYLASSLLKDGVDVKIIEKEQNRCEVLSQELPRATILCGDGTDHRVLEEEGLKNSDAFISLTGVDEENAIISIFAKMKGVDKIVTKIDREIVSSMVAQFGLDTIISPKSIIANHIVKFIRKNKLKEDDGINNLYMLNNQVEVLEFTVKESFSRLETPLKDMKIKKSILIGGIVRENAFILPYGETTLKPKDRVIIVSKEKQIDELKDILD
jgi:trk system potassium uptake protein TrkA